MKRQSNDSKKPQTAEEVVAEFELRKPNLVVCSEKTKILIDACLEAAEIRFHSIQVRIKSQGKLKEKYNNPKKKYKKLDDITDLVGLRIITYYDDEIDGVAEVIKREFKIDKLNSNLERVIDPEKFGYDAINLVCTHATKRSKQVEYSKIKGIKFEIQITSILGHAWAEMNHDWYDLQDSYPAEIKRRFSRMRALLEVAESEFLALRKTRSDYQKSLSVRIEAGISGIPIDAVSLKSFIEQDPTPFKIDTLLADIRKKPLVSAAKDSLIETLIDLLEHVGIEKFEDVINGLKKFEPEIIELAKLTQPFITKPGKPKVARGISVFYLTIIIAAQHKGTLALLKKIRAHKWIEGKVHLAIEKMVNKR